MACGLGQGTVLTPARHAAKDQTRIARVTFGRAQPQPFHHTGAEPFDQTIGRLQQLQQGLDVLRVFEIQFDGTFAAIQNRLGRSKAIWLFALAMNADDIRPKIRQHHRRKRTGPQPFDFDDPNALQHDALSPNLLSGRD